MMRKVHPLKALLVGIIVFWLAREAGLGQAGPDASNPNGQPSAKPSASPKANLVVPRNLVGQNILSVSLANVFTSNVDLPADDPRIITALKSSSDSNAADHLLKSAFNPPGGVSGSTWTVTDVISNQKASITCKDVKPILQGQAPPSQKITVRSPAAGEVNPPSISSGDPNGPFSVLNLITEISGGGLPQIDLYTSFLSGGTKDPALTCGLDPNNIFETGGPGGADQDLIAIFGELNILGGISPTAANTTGLNLLPLDGSKFLIYAELKTFADTSVVHKFSDAVGAGGKVSVFQARVSDGTP